ncbi:hypothetical protein V6767_20105 [Martelella sp. FLE1502]
MTTARDLILLAMKDAGVIGVGQTPLAEDMNDALSNLNAMLAQWSRRRWMVYHLADAYFQATGAEYYTLGIGGDINVARIDSVESAYFRITGGPTTTPVDAEPDTPFGVDGGATLSVQSGGYAQSNVDYPLQVLTSKEEYNRIALKQMTSFPAALFYDSGWPLGKVYIWPVPSALYEIHISFKQPLQRFSSLDINLSLPPEYEEALRLSLAVRLRVSYRLPIDQGLATLASAAERTIKAANTQLAKLQLPSDLPGSRGGRYNIFSDGGGR